MDYAHIDHPIVIFIRGLPGSGKSYLAAKLQQAFGDEAVVLIDPDAVDQTSAEYQQHVAQQTKEGVDPALHLYRFSRARAYKAIEENKIIIWNQPFTNLAAFAKIVDRLTTHAAESGTTIPILVVEVKIDLEIAKQRVVARKQSGGHGPSNTTFERFVREYVTARTEGYKVISVDGSTDVSQSVQHVMQAVEKLA